MNELMQKLFDKEAEERRYKENLEIAERMLKKGYKQEEAAEILQISNEAVAKIAERLQENPVA